MGLTEGLCVHKFSCPHVSLLAEGKSPFYYYLFWGDNCKGHVLH